MPTDWTPERRRQQAERIRQWKRHHQEPLTVFRNVVIVRALIA